MTDEREYLTEDEAARLWTRAAQLQAEAADRAETSLAPGTDPPAGSLSGYALPHVVAAAAEAGIGHEFLDAALADLRAEKAVALHRPKAPWNASRTVLGRPADAVTVRRAVRADVVTVLAAMEAVMPHPPYRLALRDRLGDPAHGGALLFDIEGASFAAAGSGGFVGTASWADFRQVVATACARPGRPPTTDLVIRAPITWAMNLNALFGAAFTGVGAGLGGIAGLAVASAVGAVASGGVGLALAAILCAGGAGTAGAGSLRAYRALYRHSLRRGEGGLVGLLGAVTAHAEGGWGFPPQTPLRPAESTERRG